MTTQINKVFGETLEFSCTVGEGKIISQELVTSGPDALVSFKLDKDNFLDPDELEDISAQIRAALTGGKVSLASAEQTDAAIANAKATLRKSGMFVDAIRVASLAIAEHELNKVGLTMYQCCVTKVEQVAAPKTWGMATTAVAAGYDVDDEGDDWDDEDDEDDSWDYGYDCECDDCMDEDDDEDDIEDDEDDDYVDPNMPF